MQSDDLTAAIRELTEEIRKLRAVLQARPQPAPKPVDPNSPLVHVQIHAFPGPPPVDPL